MNFFRISIPLLCITIFNCKSFTPISNQGFPSLDIASHPEKYKILGVSDGISCESYFLFFHMAGNFTYHTAVRKAVRKLKGDFLIPTTTDVSFSHFLYIMSDRCLLVEGLVIKIKGLKKNAHKHPIHLETGVQKRVRIKNKQKINDLFEERDETPEEELNRLKLEEKLDRIIEPD